MKKLFFLAFFLLVSSAATTDSESTIKFFKCLLIDSDVTYNQLNKLLEAIQSMDPVKLIDVFTTIYPAISAEVKRCKNEKYEETEKPEEEEKKIEEVPAQPEEKPVDESQSFFKQIWKLFIQYVLPVLNSFGINLASICKMILPDSIYCSILEFL